MSRISHNYFANQHLLVLQHPPTRMEVEKWDASKKRTGPSLAKGASFWERGVCDEISALLQKHAFKTKPAIVTMKTWACQVESLSQNGVHPIVEGYQYHHLYAHGGFFFVAFFFPSTPSQHFLQLLSSLRKESSSWNQCSKSLLAWQVKPRNDDPWTLAAKRPKCSVDTDIK